MLRHTLYLEEFSYRLASEWLAEGGPQPGSSGGQQNIASQDLSKNVTLTGLRQDRMLNEAFASGDLLELIRLFGITAQTATRCVGASCPERTVKLPR